MGASIWCCCLASPERNIGHNPPFDPLSHPWIFEFPRPAFPDLRRPLQRRRPRQRRRLRRQGPSRVAFLISKYFLSKERTVLPTNEDLRALKRVPHESDNMFAEFTQAQAGQQRQAQCLLDELQRRQGQMETASHAVERTVFEGAYQQLMDDFWR